MWSLFGVIKIPTCTYINCVTYQSLTIGYNVTFIPNSIYLCQVRWSYPSSMDMLLLVTTFCLHVGLEHLDDCVFAWKTSRCRTNMSNSDPYASHVCGVYISSSNWQTLCSHSSLARVHSFATHRSAICKILLLLMSELCISVSRSTLCCWLTLASMTMMLSIVHVFASVTSFPLYWILPPHLG